MNAPLVTDEQRAALLVNGRLAAADEPHDPLPVVRLFTPDAHATWLLAALDPADGDTAYGLIDLGISMPELGHVKLSDLASIVGPNKLPVMRDRYFQAVRPLSEYLRLAQENGSIVDCTVRAPAKPGALRLFQSGIRPDRSESALLLQTCVSVAKTVTIFHAGCGTVFCAA